jgi:hypothetical protein
MLRFISCSVYIDIEKWVRCHDRGIYGFLSGNHFTLNTRSFSQRAAMYVAINKMTLNVMDVPINRFCKCVK